MLTVILLYVVVLFVIEVHFGSDTGIFNAEIGYEPRVVQITKLPAKKFFRQLLPLAILCTGGFYVLVHSLMCY
jgi:hypothetical protein